MSKAPSRTLLGYQLTEKAMAQLPTQSMRLVNRYAILEPDGVTVAEMADDEDSALMAAPKEGRLVQRDGVTRYVAKDGAWCWMPGGR